MNKVVQSNLRALLKARDLEQKQLAEMTGLSVRTISELANNKSKQYPKKALEAISEALNISDMNEIISIIDVEIKESD